MRLLLRQQLLVGQPQLVRYVAAEVGDPGGVLIADETGFLKVGRTRDLYEQALAIAQRLAEAEPGNTTYARDLSVSFDRLADLAREAGQEDQAQIWVTTTLDIRRKLVRDEPRRLDLAEELAYVLYLSAISGTPSLPAAPSSPGSR